MKRPDQCQPQLPAHPVHASELSWLPVVLISLRSPSTASPLWEGDKSVCFSDSSCRLGSSLTSRVRLSRMTVAGGLLSCIGDPNVRGGVRWDFFTQEESASVEGWAGRSGVLWKGVELMSCIVPTRGVRNWEGVVTFLKEAEGVERVEREIRGHLRLCASNSDTRRSKWWLVTLRMAVCRVFRRSIAFWLKRIYIYIVSQRAAATSNYFFPLTIIFTDLLDKHFTRVCIFRDGSCFLLETLRRVFGSLCFHLIFGCFVAFGVGSWCWIYHIGDLFGLW